MKTNLNYVVLLSVVGIRLLSADAAHAQDSYPSKPIQLVVTTAAGGALDLVARTVADRLSASIHQPVIIDNQPAGNGSVAAGQFAKAMPDGHTLMMVVDSEPIREVLESDESDVIPCWALDSLESADVEARTAPCRGPQWLTLPERSDR